MQECRITRTSGEALDLRVWASPVEMADQRFTFFILKDISDEKRRRVLERAFFHDILNTAGGLQGFLELLQEVQAEEQPALADTALRLSRTLIREIRDQKNLAAAERGELEVHLEPVNLQAALQELTAASSQLEVALDHRVVISQDASEPQVITDPVLLHRVLLNLVKNALEAAPSGSAVTMGWLGKGDEVEFWVHNQGHMPRKVQLQVFQRSFSTKGAGRGIGTYSVKLLTERYLGGRVTFTSEPQAGTTFRIRLPVQRR